MTLDPQQLVGSASLNRAEIRRLPGAELDADIPGRTAGELLSQAAAAALVRARLADLGLLSLAGAHDAELVRRLDALLASADPSVRGAAEQVAARLGRRLAALLAVLRRGDAPNREARPDWDDSYWAHWAGVRTVLLGGGMAAGALGAAIARHAAAELPRLGVADVAVRGDVVWRGVAQLMGAARRLPADAPGGLVCDFGHTGVKAAWAQVEGGALRRLALLPRLPVAFSFETRPGAPPGALAEEALCFVAGHLTAAWGDLAARGLPLCGRVGVSMACYVDEAANHPLEIGRGIYALAAEAARPLGAHLGASLSAYAGRPLEVRLGHDGTCAALAFAGMPAAAVIMLGTSLGVGFPPPSAAGLLPLAPDFGAVPLA